MTLLVLFILAVIWAAVLLPPYLQNRSESRPADSISSFQKQLSVLERRAVTVNPTLQRTVPPYSRTASRAVRMTKADARRRRRDVLFTLMAAAGVTFLLAGILGGSVWGLHLLCDVLLVGYVVLLVQTNQRSVERDAKVRYLPARGNRAPEPALLLRRSGS